jgi:NAD(P)-dependent dehydrogenase (short-subunit alcohol dehydrogenase family)
MNRLAAILPSAQALVQVDATSEDDVVCLFHAVNNEFGRLDLLVNSAGDWGPSRPVAVPDFIVAMRARGHAESLIEKVVLDNPLTLFSRCRRYVPPLRVAGRA